MRLIDADALLEESEWVGERATYDNPMPEGEEMVSVESILNAPTVLEAEATRMNDHTIWIYSFDDGTQLKLLDTGFSMKEIIALEKLHGKCVMSHKRIRW